MAKKKKDKKDKKSVSPTMLAFHEFANGRAIVVEALDPDDPQGDTLGLGYVNADATKVMGVALRPDEVVKTIELLSKALYQHVKTYGVLRRKP